LFGGELLERSKKRRSLGTPSRRDITRRDSPPSRPGRARGPGSLHEICENWLPPSTGSPWGRFGPDMVSVSVKERGCS
jgi:hypothetical protein